GESSHFRSGRSFPRWPARFEGLSIVLLRTAVSEGCQKNKRLRSLTASRFSILTGEASSCLISKPQRTGEVDAVAEGIVSVPLSGKLGWLLRFRIFLLEVCPCSVDCYFKAGLWAAGGATTNMGTVVAAAIF
ncbi:unnamed protein product, partial [Phaeothamnion confervicola]